MVAPKHVRAQKTLQELNFDDLKIVLERANLKPLAQDKVTWVMDEAKAKRNQALEAQHTPLPSYLYVIEGLGKLADSQSNLIGRFLERLRNAVYHDMAQEPVLKASPYEEAPNPFRQASLPTIGR
jgi:hypothetical protein